MLLADGYHLQCSLSLKATISATVSAANRVISFDLFIPLLQTVMYVQLRTPQRIMCRSHLFLCHSTERFLK